MTKYVALYCRLSPRPDGSYEGVPLQERWGREYAANTWPGIPVEVFADQGISAANGDHRPRFEALREALGRGEVAHLWTVEQTRLERTEVGWFTLAAELDAAGIGEVHTNRDGIVRVLDDVAGIKAVLAAGEVRKLKRRVNDRLAELAAEGRPSGAEVYGYRHGVDAEGRKTLEVVPEEASVVREAAEKILAGWGVTRVASEFAERGLIGKHGGKMRVTTVRSMVTNPAVAGKRVYRGQIVGEALWEPVLDEDTWQAVRTKLETPRTVQRADGLTYPMRMLPRTTGRRYLLTGGVAVCAVCGERLIASMRPVGKTRKPYYLCSPRVGGRACVGILGEELEAHVVASMLDELDKPEFRAALAADGHDVRRDELNAQLRKVEMKRRTLAAEWAADELTDKEWRGARADLDARERQLRVDLAAVPPPVAHVDPALIREAWEAMNLDECREIIRMFVDRASVDRARPGASGFDARRVEISWRRR